MSVKALTLAPGITVNAGNLANRVLGLIYVGVGKRSTEVITELYLPLARPRLHYSVELRCCNYRMNMDTDYYDSVQRGTKIIQGLRTPPSTEGLKKLNWHSYDGEDFGAIFFQDFTRAEEINKDYL